MKDGNRRRVEQELKMQSVNLGDAQHHAYCILVCPLSPPSLSKKPKKTKKQHGEKSTIPNYLAPPSSIRIPSRLWAHLRASTALFGKKWYYSTNIQAIGFLVLFKVDKNHNSLLTNKHRLKFLKNYNHISYKYPALAINNLHCYTANRNNYITLFLLWKFLVMKNLLLLWVVFATAD